MYWLEADIQIRQQTHDQKSLVDALRAILAEGGDGSVIWQPEKVFDIGDRATGTKVLATLFHQYGELPGGVDLNDLWKQLGVEYRDEAITFHDDAPLANIRRSITGAP
jgi:predicted metalloprotease with PDZ domain